MAEDHCVLSCWLAMKAKLTEVFSAAAAESETGCLLYPLCYCPMAFFWADCLEGSSIERFGRDLLAGGLLEPLFYLLELSLISGIVGGLTAL